MSKKQLGRIIHFANLPLKLVLPKSRENITEVAFKTIPSASKVNKQNKQTFLATHMHICMPQGRTTLCMLQVECAYAGAGGGGGCRFFFPNICRN
jgi:hypothetical protein